MGYTITNYSNQKAKKYDVIIKPSKKKNKKIDNKLMCITIIN